MRMHSITIGLATATVSAGLAAGLGTAAQAAEPTVGDRARQIMGLTAGQFVNHDRGGNNAIFDWSTDGCSSPVPGDPYRAVFANACKQHDFGYRNFGGQGRLQISPTAETKKWIDVRFHEEMRRICNERFVPVPASPSDHEYCMGAAGAYFAAVSYHGDQHFF